MPQKKYTRREFLTKTGAAAAAISFPYFVCSKALGRDGFFAPSNKITMGFIGLNNQGTINMKSFLSNSDVQVVAVCDVDQNVLLRSQQIVNDYYKNKDCSAYADFRELCARKDIDAICQCTPDHWHAIISIEALKSGKDVYGEKPLAHTLREGRAICDAVKKYGRIWQTGSWQRSQYHFRQACQIVRNGRIGKVHTVEVGLSGIPRPVDETITAPPKELDYDMWLGPAPYAPYCKARLPYQWRWILDYGGGQLMDWIGHHGDIVQWGLGTEYTCPVEMEEHNVEFLKSIIWNAASKFYLTGKYANGVKIVIEGNYGKTTEGAKWIGNKGWVWVSRNGIDASPKSLLNESFGPNDIQLYKSNDHYRNFLDCIKSRQQTIAPAEVAHRSASIGQLAQIALLLRRKIRFNPETEEIIDDETASRLLGKSMRSPWRV